MNKTKSCSSEDSLLEASGSTFMVPEGVPSLKLKDDSRLQVSKCVLGTYRGLPLHVL